MVLLKFIRKMDGFRSLPAELTEASLSGGWMSIMAYCIMAFLFASELMAFLSPKTVTSISMDVHQHDLLEIHFDITMHKLPCSAADVQIWDTFREQPLQVESKSLTKTKIDFGGNEMGVHEDDPHYLVEHKEEHPEFDLDWDKTSEQFKNMHFNDIIKYHDFTFINFYADWCIHCRNFAPHWKKIENETDAKNAGDKYKDGDGNAVIAKMLRINCVEFPSICREQGIRWYPSMRLYKVDKSFVPFKGERQEDVVRTFLLDAIKNSHHIVNKDHKVHEEGCRLEGAIRTLRVPGEFHIQAKDKKVELEPAMTNVTHTVNSLIFLDDGEKFVGFLKKFEHLVPTDVLINAQPFSGQTFVAEKVHDAPQHYISVVSTIFDFDGYDPLTIYQTSSQSHIKKEFAQSVPQAKFSYSLSPMSVKLTNESMPIYVLLTQIFAIIGGTYTVISLLNGFVGTVALRYKTNIGKLG